MNKMVMMSYLKNTLAKSDYKVIKCMEAQLIGKEMPYDVEALVAEREGYRLQINELEALESDASENVRPLDAMLKRIKERAEKNAESESASSDSAEESV